MELCLDPDMCLYVLFITESNISGYIVKRIKKPLCFVIHFNLFFDN